MEEIWWIAGLTAVLTAGQGLCFFAGKIWIRLIPLIVIGVLLGMTVVAYCLSGGTNWGYLILGFLLMIPLTAILTSWTVYGFVRLIRWAIKQ